MYYSIGSTGGGVRYNIDHAQKYIQNNIIGFKNILEIT